MRAPESFPFSNISATPAPFYVTGGVYALDVIATWNSTGTVTLSRLGPDGSTYLTAATAISANGTSGAIALPPGQYELIIATATAVYANLTRIPGE